MNFFRKNQYYISSTIMAVIAVCICVILILGSNDNGSRTVRSVPSYRELSQWEIENRDISAYAGVERIYTTLLPTLSDFGEYLFIYFVHEFSEVWIDDELVADCREPDGWQFGQTPGCYWLKLPMREEDSGHTLRIVTRPVYKNVLDRTPMAVVSDWSLMIHVYFRNSGSELALCIVNTLAGVIFAVGALLVLVNRRQRKQLFYLGLSTLSIGLWRLCDLPLMPLMFPGAARILYYLTMLGIMTSPVFFSRFLAYSYEDQRAFAYNVLSRIIIAVFLVQLGLQFFNIWDFREIIHVSIICMIITGIPILLWSLQHLIFHRENFLSVIYDCLYIAFVVAGIGDACRFSLYRSSHYLSWLLCITTSHLIIMTITIIYNSVENTRNTYALKAELAEERTRVMLSQIQPHFLYNCLSVIRELCHSDPARAEQATVKFSQYLRKNMDSLREERPIPFSEELQHTRNYLELEQIRFGDALNVEYDIQTSEFSIPALVLETIVENAVRHGIRKKDGGGTVKIQTMEKDLGYQITVTDDGPGFDTRILQSEDYYGRESTGNIKVNGRSHVGLKAARHRLEHFCGGKLTVQSEESVGTTVTIWIPYAFSENADSKN